MSDWNKSTFGNIFHQKKNFLSRLKGIQSNLHHQQNSNLILLENQLQNNLNTILIRERQFWATKSRITWLNHGDANTSFFHITAIKRRRRNIILSLRDSVGNWISDTHLLHRHISNYFLNCFTTEATSCNLFSNYPIHHLALSNTDQLTLLNPISPNEIVSSIKSFKSYKGPGPNGFHPFFFKKFLSNTLPAIQNLFNEIFLNEVVPSEINQTYICLIPKQANP